MKKNILVILVVIAVFGVVVYLLKDRLKALLGERVEGEETPGVTKANGAWAYMQRHFGPDPEKWGDLGLNEHILPGIATKVYRTPVESPARWLIIEIAPILEPMYPASYKLILRRILDSLLGKTQPTPDPYITIPPPEFRTGITSPGPYIELKKFETPATSGPYSWALPQF